MRTEKKKVFVSPKRDGVGAFVERTAQPETYKPVDLLSGFGPARPQGLMARALTNGAGVSFAARHQGPKDTMAKLVPTGDAIVQQGEHPLRRLSFRDTEGALDLDVEITYYPEHGAMLLAGQATNTGNQPIEHIQHLRSLHVAFDAAWSGDTTPHTLGGGTTHFCFPPYAFQMDERLIMGSLWSEIAIDSGDTGRSSDDKMPFFFLTDDEGGSGVFGALEWSGSWKMGFHRKDEYLYVYGGMRDVDTTLRPGETLAFPRALLGFWDGDLDAGHNALRRFIRAWYPKCMGEDVGAPVTWNHAFTFGPSICDAVFRKQVPVCRDLGFEWMQIDWGWYGGCQAHKNADGSAARGIGNWFTVDEERFPDGIEPLADLVRENGMRYCTWIDPEQASPISDMARRYPQWMLYHPDAGAKKMCLVNFALPQVQDFFIDLICGLVRKWGVHKLKWDNNIDPQAYWSYHDDPAHRGMLEMGHIRGVWRVWDAIREKNPGLVLENCSSGGRRFDLGTFGHAHLHHGSDFNFHDDIVRNQIHGMNTVMPSYRVIHTCTWGGHDYPDTYVQTRFGGILRFSQDFASWPAQDLARTKQHIEVYKSIRHLLREDYYPLFPQPRAMTDWDGWQFHAPDSGEGFVQVFRMRGKGATVRVRLMALKPNKAYVLENPYTGDVMEILGEQLMDKGIEVETGENTAVLWHYHEE